MPVDTFAESLRALLDDYDARGSRLTELEQKELAWQDVSAELRAQLATLQAENVRLTALLASAPPPVDPEPPTLKLKYAPPTLVDPETRVISKPGTVRLDPARDYILKLDGVIDGYVPIVGGRNWTLIGGEFNIPHQGARPTISSRTALKVKGVTGTAHVEGLWMHGDDLSEGIQIDAPAGIVQIQNCRADGLHIRSDPGWIDPQHSDAIQTYGNVRVLRVDKFSFSSAYQGIFLKADYNGPHGAVSLRRVNGVGLPQARYLFWVNPQALAGIVTLEDVWMQPAPDRPGGFGKTVWLDVGSAKTIIEGSAGAQVARWVNTTPEIVGSVYEGAPPNGDFVPEGIAGMGYVSPGYAEFGRS